MLSDKGTLVSAFFSLRKWQEEEKKRRDYQHHHYKFTNIYLFDGGGCDGCMMELSLLKNGIFSLKARGFHFVTRPEEAEWLLVTGLITRHRLGDLQNIWNKMPEGRSLIAVGNCAINGGVFKENYAALNGLEQVSSHFYRLQGCPPSPRDLCYGFSALEAEISAKLASA